MKEYMEPEERLAQVARILAEGILRARLRRILKGNPALGTREKGLEVSASSSAHASRKSRSGENT